MRTKFTATLMAVTAMFALVAGPAHAQDADPDTEKVDQVEVPSDGDGLGQVRAAAARAKAAAQDLEDGDAGAELEAIKEAATEALQAALDRLSVEGAGGSGVASKVLTALLDGRSPAEIGAAHGAEMAQAAADHRANRTDHGQGRPEDAGRPEGAGIPNDAGRSKGAGRP